MTLAHGKNSALLIGGVNVSGSFNQVDSEGARDLHDTTCLGDGGHRWTPGHADGALALRGFLDVTTDAQLEALVNGQEGPDPFIFAPNGTAAGSPCIFGMARASKYNLQSSSKDVVKTQIDFKLADNAEYPSGVTNGGSGFFSGVIAGPLASKSNAGSYVLDRGTSAPSYSSMFALLVMSSSLPTNSPSSLTVSQVEHSADNVTYTSLTSSRIGWGPSSSGLIHWYGSHGGMSVITGYGVINRYVRITYGSNGAPSPGYPTNTTFAVGGY